MSQVDPLPGSRSFPYRDDATRWVWVCYGLAQAVITMLMAFDVIQTLTVAEVVTAVTLVIYVAVNELLVRPGVRRRERAMTAAAGQVGTLPRSASDLPPPPS